MASDPEAPRRDGIIEKLIEWSAHNKFVVLALTAAAMAAAVWSVRTIPLDAPGRIDGALRGIKKRRS